MSRFAIVPIIRRKTNSAVSDRVITALRKSNFCSSSPVIKRLLIRNIHVWCIVFETSGNQSIKVFCASVPYLLKLLSRANPKLKQILENESVASYLKFFRETDLESLLASVCAATVIIKNGIQMCQPTVCVELSRDILVFGNSTLKAFLNILYEGVVSAFQFLWEELGPAFRSFCYRNRGLVKYIATNLPVYALATAKSLVLFSFFVRRIIQYSLKLIKRFVKFIFHVMQETSSDYTLSSFLENFKYFLTLFSTFELPKSVYEYCKYVCLSSSKWFMDSAITAILFIYPKCSSFVKNSFPFIKDYIRLALQNSIVIAHLLEENIVNAIHICYNLKPAFEKLLFTWKPYLIELYKIMVSLAENIGIIEKFVRPYVKQCFMCMLKNCMYLGFKLIQAVAILMNYASNNIHEIYPKLKYFLINLFKILNQISKHLIDFITNLLSVVLHVMPTVYHKVQPIFLPISIEIQSIVISSSNEVITKSNSSLRRVVPSIYNSLKTTSPQIFWATHEFVTTYKNAFSIMYPTMLKTFVVIYPDITKAIVVVLKDGQRAFLEVSKVSYSGSGHLLVAAKDISKQIPLIFNAVNEVYADTFNALIGISSTSCKAHGKVINDFNKAGIVAKASFKTVELEIKSVVDEIILEINDALYDSPDLLDLIKKSLIIGPYFQSQLSYSTSEIFSYVFSKFEVGYSVLKTLLSSLMKQLRGYVSNYFISSSDLNTVLNIALLYLTKKIDTKVYSCTYYLIQNLLSSVQFQNLCHNFKDLTTVLLHSLSALFKLFISSEFVDNAVPNSWNTFKLAIFTVWETFCKLAKEGWELFENLSIKTWYFVNKHFPTLWDAFKIYNESLWNELCKYGPSIWEFILKLTPIMWSFNCLVVRFAWNMYVDTCSETWSHTLPFTSRSWSYALNNCPKLWISLSEKAQSNWKLFCYASENSWDTVAYTISQSWNLGSKIVSKSWHCGIRDVTTFVFCRTSAILVNSLKISYKMCAKTEKIMYFLYDELYGTSLPLINFYLDSPESEENDTVNPKISNNCIDFYPANTLKQSSKRIVFQKIEKLIKIPIQISKSYGNFLKLDKMVDNVFTITKVSCLPVYSTYTLGQCLVKKYYSTFTSFKNVYFSSEISPLSVAYLCVE